MDHARTPRSPLARWSWRSALAALAALGFATARGAAGQAAGIDAEALKFFETEVRPVLIANCVKCHGPDKQKGGLRLDARAAVLAGGDLGPAVVPGNPDESLLVEAIGYASDDLKMPPSGVLPEPQRAALTRWVKLGAPWPDTGGPAVAAASSTSANGSKLTAEDRAFWSFQPVGRPALPATADGGWARNAIDRFVFARLAAAGLTPAPEADRRTLFRRLTFDLTGLPPDPAEVEAFAADPDPDAYEHLVDRLLASPRYGERWARHWLDLVRYAESDGYRADSYRPDAWRYRDYVIRALNQDRPYDRFVTEQLAGDELDPNDPEMKVATGFFRLGTYEHNQRDVPGQWSAILNDITDVASDVFLGLGMGCARCHDHKFDPILQRDYYRLQAFFAPILPRDDLDLAPSDNERGRYAEALAAWNAQTADIRREIDALERPYRESAKRGAIAKFPAETQAILQRPARDRSPLEEQLAQLAYLQVIEEYDAIPGKMKKSKDKDAWTALQKRLATFDRPAPLEGVLTVRDVGPVPPPTMIPGSRSKQPVEPGFLTLLDPDPAAVVPPAVAPGSTGRRLTLARWLTRADNPLPSRVIANRVWQHHFGRGIVGTSSDFGRLGERPSHPELLDWLATELVAQGWRLKPLHRLIVTSSTYRQAAAHPDPATGRRVDPENRLVWHRSTYRLDVEPIRDAMLAVSGELDLTTGGPSVAPALPRRTVYAKVMRNTHDPLNEVFDAPDGSNTTPRRDTTVTPIQALLMINGPWTLARAKAFATRIGAEAADDPARIDRAYRLAFGRGPDPDEQAAALDFLRDQARRAAAGTGDPALVDFCHALLNSNEFIYVD